MPNKHFYFALGATHGALVAAWIYRRRHAWYPRYAWVRGLYRRDRDWTLYLPFVMVAFGLLALVGSLRPAPVQSPHEGTDLLSRHRSRPVLIAFAAVRAAVAQAASPRIF